MKTLMFFVSIFAIIFLSSCKKEETPTSSKAITYSISLSKTGNGAVEILPSKAQYDVGEEVTLHAYPDSQWIFERWEGSLLTNDNPILIKMDGNKSIKAIFTKILKTYLPNISGKWFTDIYKFDLQLTQSSNNDSTFSGKATIPLSTGDTAIYSVSGYNTPPNVKMNWYKSGNYPITYTGQWEDANTIRGTIEENGVKQTWNLYRGFMSKNLTNREKIKIGKKISYE